MEAQLAAGGVPAAFMVRRMLGDMFIVSAAGSLGLIEVSGRRSGRADLGLAGDPVDGSDAKLKFASALGLSYYVDARGRGRDGGSAAA